MAVLVSHSRPQVLQLPRHLGSCLPEGSMNDALGKLHLPGRIRGQHPCYLRTTNTIKLGTPQCPKGVHLRRRCTYTPCLKLSRGLQLGTAMQEGGFPTSFGKGNV